eukprot:6198952-Pleurochrysis_carterae.AAC.2
MPAHTHGPPVAAAAASHALADQRITAERGPILVGSERAREKFQWKTRIEATCRGDASHTVAAE